MKLFLAAVVGIALLAGQAFAAEEAVLKDQKDRVSYSIGVDIGNNLKKQSLEIDPDLLARGLKDAYTGGKTVISDQEVRDILVGLQKEMVAKQQEQAKVVAEKNKKEGDAFLAENKKKEGVVTLPSGLQYKVIKEGSGPTPKLTDTVTVNYKGSLVDGKEFDSSYRRGQPASFPVNGVIPGWTEALQLMKEGSTWEIVIPSNLAYGEKGAGGVIGPNATLIFEVELLSVKEQGSLPPSHP
ncbi:MAG TPA: FKBP-type peptidyl-prolyl cis-trans isomerase [Thermodesulfovibrionales bacterium]|nr:FKBP-type peptidyl-prolyl cis-trans isomerase [Thermodesulfovibrionales bacterium]